MRVLWFNLATDLDDPILAFTNSWIREVATRVDSIHVVTMRLGRVELPENVRIYSVGKEKGFNEPRRALEFYRHLLRILHHEAIDVCCSHMIPIFTVMAAPLLKLRGIPIVTWHAHRQVTTRLKLAHHFSDRMVTCAASAYRYKHDKLLVIGHGIDTTLFCPDGTEPDTPPLLLSVGRLSPIKDLFTLVKAVHLLQQRGHEIRCALVGGPLERDSAYAERVRQLVAKLGFGKIVLLPGALPHSEIVQWYRRCFAHVNLCSTGGLDKAALEAMACGKPCLVANEGFRETLAHWAPHLLFRHGHAEDLAYKLERLLAMSESQRRAIGTDLRQSVIEQHDLKRLADQLMSVFETVTYEYLRVVTEGEKSRQPVTNLQSGRRHN